LIDIVTYRWHEPWELRYKGSADRLVLYKTEHVDMCHRMIRKNMSLPFNLYHYSYNGEDNIEGCINLPFEDMYGGWYQLFSFMRREKPFLFIGLDNVIVDDLAKFVYHAKGRGMHTCQSEKPGTAYTGAVWVEDGPDHHKGFEKFFFAPDFNKREWHDELYIEKKVYCRRFPHEWARSYKRHYLAGENCENAIIFAFTGVPKAWDVSEKWVKEALA
jgi:hypothetical protein